MLRSALASLHNLKRIPSVQVHLLLVDNDKEAGAKSVFEEYAKDLSFPAHYEVEPVRGIVGMRNRALAYALQLNADYLAFFDDDEEVSPNWIIELHKAASQYDAHGVHGRTIYQVPEEAPQWVKEDSYFNPTEKKTGTPRPGASTNNCLIDLSFVRQNNLQFDMRMNAIGASDTLFFHEMVRKGGKIIWANEAIAYEKVPLSRTEESWILRRAYKVGFARFHRLRCMYSPLFAFFSTFGFSLSLLFRSIFHSLWLARKDKKVQIRILKNRRKAQGSFHAMLGRKYHEYDRIHGY